MNEELQCPACGIAYFNVDGGEKVFYFSHQPEQKVTGEVVYSKVCRHAKKRGCVNLTSPSRIEPLSNDEVTIILNKYNEQSEDL